MIRGVISINSIRNANARSIKRQIRGVSMDSKNVSIRCKTLFGSSDLVFSKERINQAASKALENITK